MNVKEFLKPSGLKILILIPMVIFYFNIANESTCGASFFFTFCYKVYGFPFRYMVSGDIKSAASYVSTLFLGNYFNQYGIFLLNFLSLAFDAILLYLLVCIISMLFKNIITKLHHKKQSRK